MQFSIDPPQLRWNRRNFLRTTTAAAGAITFGVPALLRAKNVNSKLNIAVIGAGGKGASDTDCCATENIYALCDADANRCATQLKKYPQAKFFRDFRRMLDEADKSLDAVIVSAPDHFHAIAASHALRLGKHVYCQKPLTQTIYESRYLRDLARASGVVTQMGNQGSVSDGLRRAVECIQSGIIGQVRQVHIWTDRPIWPQGMDRPEDADPVPETLDWDIWLGPAPVRPYKKGVYNPFNWRGWQDFGTGALGDMACHTVNMPFRALKLGYPSIIHAESSAMNSETYPLASKIRFEFPARGDAQRTSEKGAELLTAPVGHSSRTRTFVPVTLWWYDGGKPKANNPSRHDGSNKPDRSLTADIEAMLGEVPGSGCLLLGDKGQVFSRDAYGEEFFVMLTGEKKFTHYQKHEAVAACPQWLPRNPLKDSSDRRHHQEWIAAIKAGNPEDCFSRFEIGAQLTEIMLLGCVALRVGRQIDWDGPNMRVVNAPEAARFIKRENRTGWNLA